jgi:hypothetical protein
MMTPVNALHVNGFILFLTATYLYIAHIREDVM